MLRVASLCLAFALTASAQAQWTSLPGSPFDSYRWEDGAFVSPSHGWIVNGDGDLYETTDGGEAWALRSTSAGYLRTAAFVSPSQGWVGVLFSATRLYETTDGGVTMLDATARIQPAVSGGICGLFALDAQRIWGAGQFSSPAYLIHTTDGGASWTSRDMSALAGSLVDVMFLDDQRGFAVGGTLGLESGSRAVVLATEDGGATWVRRAVSSGTGTNAEWGWKITFPTPTVGFVSVEASSESENGGKILRTEDGGLRWEEIAVPGARSMQGIGFIDETTGWLSGRETSLETTDGGLTWQPDLNLDTSVNRFEFFGDTLGFAMGRVVQRLRRQTSTEAEAPPTAQLGLRAGPSPTAGPVRIEYQTPAGDATVDVFDALGRRVARLARGPHAAGAHDAAWTATAAPGVYMIRLQAADAVRIFRVLRL